MSKTMFVISKAADLNYLVQGGQLQWFFPFSEDSLEVTNPLGYFITAVKSSTVQDTGPDVIKKITFVIYEYLW